MYHKIKFLFIKIILFFNIYFGINNIYFAESVPPTTIIVNQIDTICYGDSINFRGEFRYNTGIYSDTVHNVLNDTIFNLYLYERDINWVEINAMICFGDTLTINGVNYTTTGRWEYPSTDINGCDSMFAVSVFASYPVELIVPPQEICEGDSLLFNGKYLFLDSIYRDTQYLPNNIPCPTIFILDLTVKPKFEKTIYDTISAVDSILFENTYFKNPGIYTKNYLGSNGCDSNLILILSIKDTSIKDTFIINVCSGDSVLVNGIWHKTNDTFDINITNPYPELDTLYHYIINVYPPIPESKIDDIIYEGDTFKFGNNNYINSGTYTISLIGSNGCDSIVILQLISKHQPFNVYNIDSICEGDSLLYRGFYYKNDTIMIDTIYHIIRDTVFNLNLTINPIKTTTINASICQGDTHIYNSIIHLTQGIYTYKYNSITNCDSIVYLNLNVTPSYDSNLNVNICSGKKYFFEDTLIDKSGTYFHTKTIACDTNITLNINFIDNIISNIDTNLCYGTQFYINSLLITQSGIYLDTNIDSQSCYEFIQYNVELDDISNLKFIKKNYDCNSHKGSIEIELDINYTTQWFKNNALYLNNNNIYELDTGNYKCIISTIPTCTYNHTFDISYINYPQVDFEMERNSLFDYDILYTNSSNTATRYDWTFGDKSTVSDYNIINHNISYQGLGSYTTKLIGVTNYCKDSIIKSIDIIEHQNCIFVPNAISPNGDGLNDFFEVTVCSDIIQFDNFSIRIFNRDGSEIYRALSIEELNNKNFDDPNYMKNYVYVYIIEYKLGEINKKFRGHFTILK